MMQNGDFVIGGGGPMDQVLESLRKVAHLDTTVLLQGESGTGKELAARFLHDRHPTRRNGPFVCIHCGAVPETLLESELFGHVKGAFTGSDRDRVGRFEEAHGGTLFLDEIATMTPDAQVRLLRVLQDRKITRVGSSDSRPVDVRVVVATNQELKPLIDEGSFRLDLYYRINAFPISMPPLRERPADVPPLLAFFAGHVATQLGIYQPIRFTSNAIEAMTRYDWPGNVRELVNTVEYTTIQCQEHGVVERSDLPAEIAGVDLSAPLGTSGVVVTEEGLSLRTAVTNLERELILQSLTLADGNKARAAELLDLKRTTFLEKLRRLETA